MGRAERDDGSRAPDGGLDRAAALLAVVPAAAIIGLGLAEGGFFVEAQAWATLAFAWLLAMVVFVRDRLSAGRLEIAFVRGLVGLASWVALSAAWSGDAGLSLEEAGRALLYAVAAAVVLLLARAGSVHRVLGGVLGGLAVVAGGGLVHYLLLYGDRLPHRYEGYLLFEPVGYANAVGALCAIGIVLAVGLTTHASARWTQTLSTVSLVPLAAALYLTSSRGAWLALVVGLVVLLALERTSPSALVAVGLIGGLLAIALSKHADLQGDAPRFDEAAARLLFAELLLLTVAILVVSYLLARRASRPPAPRRAPIARSAAVVIVVGTTLALALGGALDLSLGNRRDYWHVAREQWQDNPLLGAGAGAFGDYWQRATGRGARDAHTLYIETLAELGPLGLALVLGVLLIPVIVAIRARAQPLVPTALAAYVVFLVHAGVDWDWEMPVVTLAGLFCGCALLLLARERGEAVVSVRTRPWPLALSAALVAVAFAQLIASGALGGV